MIQRVVSYGGGVDSTAMVLHLLERGEKLDLVIFADTGGEFPETYEFIRRFDAYLQAKAGLYIERIRNSVGPMYDYMISRGWTPSRQFPSEIERWKIRPILQFLSAWRQGEKVEMCIGIDYDERDRQADPRRKYVTNRYPLIEAGIGREGAKRLIKAAELPLPMKSGCFFCPYQQRARWLWSRREHPDKFALSRKLEEAGNFFPQKTLYYKGPLSKIDEFVDGNETLDMVCSAAGVCGV